VFVGGTCVVSSRQWSLGVWMRICGSETDGDRVSSSMADAASSCIGLEGMFVDDADDVECEEVKRKSVMEPTLDDRQETVVVVVDGDREPF
jgi:hypothetical protein